MAKLRIYFKSRDNNMIGDGLNMEMRMETIKDSSWGLGLGNLGNLGR